MPWGSQNKTEITTGVIGKPANGSKRIKIEEGQINIKGNRTN